MSTTARAALIVACLALAACETSVEPVGSGWSTGPTRPWPSSGSASAPRDEATPPSSSPEEPGGAEPLAERVGDERVEAQVMAVITSYYRDYNGRQWGSLITHFWEEAVVTSSVRNSVGAKVVAVPAAEFVADAKITFDNLAVFKVIQGPTEIEVRGNVAHVLAEHGLQAGLRGNVVTGTDYDAFTLIRIDGRWRIASLAFSQD